MLIVSHVRGQVILDSIVVFTTASNISYQEDSFLSFADGEMIIPDFICVIVGNDTVLLDDIAFPYKVNVEKDFKIYVKNNNTEVISKDLISKFCTNHFVSVFILVNDKCLLTNNIAYRSNEKSCGDMSIVKAPENVQLPYNSIVCSSFKDYRHVK